jgi:hypothetical protein
MSLRHHPIAAQRERNVRIRATAERVARATVVAADHGTIPVAVVPANTRETEPVPPSVRRAFLERLQASLDRGAEQRAAAATVAARDVSPPTADAPTRRDRDVAAVLGRSCATCRGECCTAGGDHAFLRAESVARIRDSHASLGDAGLLALYNDHVPQRHYRGSCLFHDTTGCALPRTLRSDLCNRYICGGLTQLTSALDATGGTMAFVGAADSLHLRRMALIDVDATRSIPVTTGE